VYFDAGKTETLHAGECHDFEAATIKVENSAKNGFAHGTFFRRAI
jgi:hypothetical protein